VRNKCESLWLLKVAHASPVDFVHAKTQLRTAGQICSKKEKTPKREMFWGFFEFEN
jgi:hypothetical protein